MRKRRIFIAINLPNQIKIILQDLQKKLERLPVRWIDLKNLHITLNFLGSLKNKEIVEVKQVIEKITSNFSGFKVWLGDIRFFPNKSHAHVISVIVKSDGSLENLQKDLEKELFKLKFLTLEKREYKPHITIGRVEKTGKKPKELQEIKGIELKGEWRVNNIELLQSILLPTNAKYKILKNYSLKKANS